MNPANMSSNITPRASFRSSAHLTGPNLTISKNRNKMERIENNNCNINKMKNKRKAKFDNEKQKLTTK